MDMQNSVTTNRLPVTMPVCPRCGKPMQLVHATLTKVRREVTFACVESRCEPTKSSGVSLQG